jgi:type II secretion system protein G
MKSTDLESGFTLIELLIVISIVAILAGALIPRITSRLALARDARRLSDIHSIRDAIDRYYQDKGTYPPAKASASAGGWDVSNDGDFIPELLERGYLTELPQDPINDDTYQYRYYLYAKGQYGCAGETPYYVLGIRNFETAECATRNKGFFKCSGRDWSTEFAYVTGGGASDRK